MCSMREGRCWARASAECWIQAMTLSNTLKEVLHCTQYPKLLWNLDLLLIWNCDGVAGNQCRHLLGSQAIKLITLKHLKDRSATNQGIKNITSVKCRSMYESAYERRSRQPWRSAKALSNICIITVSYTHLTLPTILLV